MIISGGDYRVTGRIATYDSGKQDCAAPAVIKVRDADVSDVSLFCQLK